MPSNRFPPSPGEEEAHCATLEAIATAKRQESTEKDSTAAVSRLTAARSGIAERLDFIAADRRRRAMASVLLALAINAVVLITLSIFGRVRIWVPNTPADSISVVFVDLPELQPLPELRDPEVVPEPEPEDQDPEIIDEPELEEEPEPEPSPEPEEAPAPEEEEQNEEPEPILDLTPEPIAARAGEEDAAAPTPEDASASDTEELLDAATPDAGQPLPDEGPEQTPAEDENPLVEQEPEDVGLDLEEDETLDQGDLSTGDAGRLSSFPEAPDDQEAPVLNDDFFDNQTRFVRPRQALPLPSVDLPEGETPVSPGESGVVAIFCPEEFINEDKQAECAGRTEIRSGWRPGSSGENWDEAIRLLKRERREGIRAGSPQSIFSPSVARRIEDEIRARELSDPRRSQDDINNQAQSANSNLDNALGRPDIGPAPFEPSWNRREDPIYDQGDIDRLEKELREAEELKDPD